MDALSHVEEWDAAGIALHLVDLGGMSINTGSSMGKMLITMLAGFAEFERNMISERTTAALSFKKSHGQVYNHEPFGFNAKGGALVPDAIRASHNRKNGHSAGRWTQLQAHRERAQ